MRSSGHQWAYQAQNVQCRDVAGGEQQGNDADADENDGTDDGRNAGSIGAAVVAGFGGIALSLQGIPLRAPGSLLLFAVDAPLGLGVVGRIAEADRRQEARREERCS